MSRYLQTRLAVTTLAIPTLACGGDTSPDALPTAAVRDSAGVEIVDNRWSDAPAAGWSVGESPLLSIGQLSADPAYEFTQIAGAARLTDDRIAVVDGAVSELRLFDPEGRHLRTLGREGSGPEEFQSPSLAGRLPGDTLVVFDSERRWLALVHPEGGFGRTFTLPEDAGAFVSQQGLVGDEAMAFGGGMFFSSEEGFPEGRTRPNSVYGTVHLDGSPGMSLGDIPAAEMWAEVSDGGFRASLLPFGKVTVAASGPSHFYLGMNEAWDVQVYDSAGRLVRRIRTDREPAPVTATLREAFLAERLSRADDEADRTEIRARYRDVPFAESVPHYGVLRVDALGYLWVRDPSLPGDTAPVYTIFDPNGRMVGRITLPERFLPLEIGEDHLLGRVEDELGVQSLALFSLTRGR